MSTNQIRQITEGNILKIELPEIMDKEFAHALSVEIQQWLLRPSQLYALDFKNVKELKQSCYHSLVVFSQNIKLADKKIVSFNYQKKIEHQVKSDGIGAALNFVDDFQKYLSQEFPPNKPGQLDVNIINPFLMATKNTLEKQARTPIEALKPQLASVDQKVYAEPVAIAGVISLSTDTFKGSITLAFSEKVFLAIYESMFGEKHTKINHEIEDAAGELLNIIYGTAKTVLNQEHGFQLKPVLPTILSGEKITIRQQTTQKIIILPFKTQHGQFQVEISFESVAAKAAA